MVDFFALLVPFLGTGIGAACSLFMKRGMSNRIQSALTGMAAGVMTAASVWSLILPAIEKSENMGRFSFVPSAVGFWIGVFFLLLLDRIIPHLHPKSNMVEGPKSKMKRTTMLVLAVVLHNIPEGMAVGAVYAGYLSGVTEISGAEVISLALGIAIQNFPEGAIISMPLRADGASRFKSFFKGVMSGVVEPIGAAITVLLSSLIVSVLPYFLSFAAGAMMFVVVEELIPEMSQGKYTDTGTVFFAFGFTLMMSLDVAFG
ncbi:MAG: ZIP family metal transporter [Clostridia bacterium]|nr:ZIP family metal transporter [Clostridia bacterium]